MSIDNEQFDFDPDQLVLKGIIEEGPVAKPDSYEHLLKELGTKSAVIRELNSRGWSRGAIARFMDIRYQHVRNVLTNPPKKQ